MHHFGQGDTANAGGRGQRGVGLGAMHQHPLVTGLGLPATTGKRVLFRPGAKQPGHDMDDAHRALLAALNPH